MTRTSKIFLLVATTTLASTLSLGANKTPGDDVGADHTGFSFNAYSWAGTRGDADFARHVGSGDASAGQQYSISQYIQGSVGTSVPSPCTVANFYNIIRNNEQDLAVLLLISHGGDNTVSIEPFAKTPAGMAARNARFLDYLNGNVSGCPALDPAEIYRSANHDAWAIGITDDFIGNYGKMNKSLSFVSTCQGSTLIDDFTGAGGRVSVGYTGSVYFGAAAAGIKQFFGRMDGQEGLAKRPVAKAMLGLAHPLASSGSTDTTLAPAVKTLDAPCPISVGDKVNYTLDTECEQAIPGNIVGTGVTIENEIWLSKTQLQGTCVAVSSPYLYSLRLKWDDVYSDQNVARLDGNTRPFFINAHGPAHDDHLAFRLCPRSCVTDVTGDSITDIGDLLAILDAWGSSNSSADVDGNGTVDIGDLLLVLASWGEPCFTGSCCFGDYCVDDITIDECYEIGGSYLGDGTVCTDLYECVSVGSCCFAPYECHDDITEDDCLVWGGTFGGNDSTCDVSDCWYEPTGACCYESGSCSSSMTISECESAGGYFFGPDSDCTMECPFFDPGGACCIQSDNGPECIGILPEEDCIYLDGDYHGPGTTCDLIDCAPTGACCVTVGNTPSCTDSITEDLCDDGSWYEGSMCEDIVLICTLPWGVCCLADGTCLDGSDEVQCEYLGGTFSADQTCASVECDSGTDPVGACCIPYGDYTLCLDNETEMACWYMGGSWFMGQFCSDVSCE